MLSDGCFQSRRPPAILVFTAGQLASLVGLYVLAGQDALVNAAMVLLVCVFLLGQYTMVSYTVPADLPPQIVGVGCGCLTVAAYVASGLSGLALAQTIRVLGYLGWWCTLVGATVVGLAFIVVATLGRPCRGLKPAADKTVPLRRAETEATAEPAKTAETAGGD